MSSVRITVEANGKRVEVESEDYIGSAIQSSIGHLIDQVASDAKRAFGVSA